MIAGASIGLDLEACEGDVHMMSMDHCMRWEAWGRSTVCGVWEELGAVGCLAVLAGVRVGLLHSSSPLGPLNHEY